MKAKEKALVESIITQALYWKEQTNMLSSEEDVLRYGIQLAIKETKKEFSDKIKKGITKMEKDGHKLPRRNIHYMIDLLLKKHLK